MAPISHSKDRSLTAGLGPQVDQRYVYTPLPTLRSIRVIEWPRSLIQTTDLRCRLRTIDLADPNRPPFTAVSYTWGGADGVQLEDTESGDSLFTNTIICDGGLLRITENAHAALCELRWRGRSCLIWVDAVCVNQGDVQERNEQVSIMGQIFSEAERVIIWLGEDDKTAREAYKVHNTVMAKPSLSTSRMNQKLVDDYLKQSLQNSPKDFLSLRIPDAIRSSLYSFLDFLARPWFQRLWIIQEVVLAKKLLVFCGGLTFGWDVIVRIAHSEFAIETLHESVESETVERGLQGLALVRLVSLLRGDDLGFQGLVASIFGFQSDEERFCATLGTLISAFQDSRASDNRDRIYAPLTLTRTLCNTGPAADLQPNYEESIEETFSRLSHYILQQTSSLALLGLHRTCDRKFLGSVPSWVPDFRARSRQKSINWLSDCNASRGWGMSGLTNTLHGRLLKVTGVKYQNIDKLTDSVLAVLREDGICALLKFVSLSYPVIVAKRMAECVLLRTIIMGATENVNPLLHFNSLTALYYNWFEFKIMTEFYEKGGESIQEWLAIKRDLLPKSLNYHEDPTQTSKWDQGLEHMLQEFSNLAIDEEEKWIGDDDFDSVLEVVNKYAKIIGRTEAKDERKLIHGWHMAAQFESAICSYVTDRALLITADGNIGLSPRTGKVGDEIWFLRGAKTPVILRPLGSNGNYQFIGEAYIEGLMDGRVCDVYTLGDLGDVLLA